MAVMLAILLPMSIYTYKLSQNTYKQISTKCKYKYNVQLLVVNCYLGFRNTRRTILCSCTCIVLYEFVSVIKETPAVIVLLYLYGNNVLSAYTASTEAIVTTSHLFILPLLLFRKRLYFYRVKWTMNNGL